MTHFYDRQGRPFSFDDWSALFADQAYKLVALDTVGDVSISTIWSGYDQTGMSDDCVNIFETLVRDPEVGPQVRRWNTEEEALAGHELLVRLLKLTMEIAG